MNTGWFKKLNLGYFKMASTNLPKSRIFHTSESPHSLINSYSLSEQTPTLHN